MAAGGIHRQNMSSSVHINLVSSPSIHYCGSFFIIHLPKYYQNVFYCNRLTLSLKCLLIHGIHEFWLRVALKLHNASVIEPQILL